MPTTAAPSQVPAIAADPAALFPPDDWIYERVLRVGIPRNGLRPCSCGSTRFILILRADGSQTFPVCCAGCYGEPRHRMARPDDLIYARLDITTQTVTYAVSDSEINCFQERIKARGK